MADLRIDNADWLLTLDRDRRILRDGAVAVAGGRVIAVGEAEHVGAAPPAPPRLCVLELLKSGVTPFIDAGNSQPHLTAEVAGAAGLRCVVARSSFDVAASAMGVLPPSFIETTEQALERAEGTVRRLHGLHGGRVHAWFHFRGLNNSTDRLIVGLK